MQPAAPRKYDVTDLTSRWVILLKYAAHGIGLFYLLSFLYIAWRHLGYPFELEWMEGGMLEHVRRLVQGEPLYVAPSLEFIPFTYTPLYFLLSAVLGKFWGVHLMGLRFISILSTLFSMGLLALWARRETGSWHLGWLALSLFAATYVLSGAWWTLARVDMLFLLLLLLAGYLLRQGRSRTFAALSGLFLALAFFCKQTGLLIALPLLVYAFFYEPPSRRWPFLITYAIVMFSGVLYYEGSTQGWFLFYCYQVPSQHPWVPWRIHHFWLGYFVKPLGIATLFALTGLISALRRLRDGGAFWLFFSVTVFSASWISQVPSGSYDNVAIPGHAVLALLCAMGMACWMKSRRDWSGWLWGFMALQLLMLYYDPGKSVPGREELEAQEKWLQQLSAETGPVWMPGSVYLAAQAGHGTFAHRCAIEDVLRTRENSGERGLSLELKRVIASGYFSLIVMDDDWLAKDLARNYERQPLPVSNTILLMPLTGWQTCPRWWYARKKAVNPE